MVKRAFTLMEVITTITILSLVSLAVLMSVDKIYKSYERSKTLTTLNLQKELLSSQIEALLSSRVPASLITYDPKNLKFASIFSNKSYPIFEWISFEKEALDEGDYSSFLDMKRCDISSLSLFSPDTNLTKVNERVKERFSKSGDLFSKDEIVLIFSGPFDDGGSPFDKDFKNFYGWHQSKEKKIIKIKNSSQTERFFIKNKPFEIFEKFYLCSSAYAIALAKDIDKNEECIKKLPVKIKESDLLLFYDYRPWKKESFCADPNSSSKAGKVTILSRNIKDFKIKTKYESILFEATLFKKLKTKHQISLFTQKVIF